MPIPPLSAGPRRKKPSNKLKWTAEEDAVLRRIVDANGARKWKQVTVHLPNRTEAQCQHRWLKVLRPDLKRGPWTAEEDETLRRVVAEETAKGASVRWSVVSALLPGRIGKQCRERYINACDPKISKEPWTAEEDRIVYVKKTLLD